MEYKEWSFLDRSGWVRGGEWDDEPQDKVQFVDGATGYPCLAKRNRFGAWCGYCGVVEGHPAFDKSYHEVDVDIHGGLTFCGFCAHEETPDAICHVPGPGEPDRVFWHGFDCLHAWDLAPDARLDLGFARMGLGWHDCRYRTLAYVKAECARLAAQLKAMEAA